MIFFLRECENGDLFKKKKGMFRLDLASERDQLEFAYSRLQLLFFLGGGIKHH